MSSRPTKDVKRQNKAYWSFRSKYIHGEYTKADAWLFLTCKHFTYFEISALIAHWDKIKENNKAMTGLNMRGQP